MAATRTKVADKQELIKKLHTALKKKYPQSSKSPNLPVLETMLFAVCLENAPLDAAHTAYQKLVTAFHDLNEIRVSSLDEIEPHLNPLGDADWRAMRFRGVLQFVFELNFTFELESLKKKTLDLAVKQLQKIRVLTPFVRNYTLQASLGAHVIPLDDKMYAVLEALDLQAEQGGLEATSDALRSFVRKADGPEFSALLRSFSLDPASKQPVHHARHKPAAVGATLPPPTVRLEKFLKGEKVDWILPPKKDKAATAAAATPSKKGEAAKPDMKPAAKPAASKSSPPAKGAAQPAKSSAKPPAKAPSTPPAKASKPAAKPAAAKAKPAASKPAAKAEAAKKPVAKKPAPKPAAKASKPATKAKSGKK